MHTRRAVTKTDVLIGVTVLLAIIVAAVAVLKFDPFAEQGGGGPGLDDDRETRRKIDPALIQYRQTGDDIPVEMQQVRGLAVGPDDQIYVAGDKAIGVLGAGGTRLTEISLDGEPRCLAVGDRQHVFPGRIYVGMNDHVEVLEAGRESAGVWKTLGEKALLTSIAVAEKDVFVADAGNRIVWRYDTAGKLSKGRIGTPDKARKIPGFLVTSAYFDLDVSPEGLLCVVNPRRLRIEAYTFDGDLESFWGKAASGIEGFFGCCNPVQFTLLSDGRFVTAEKGIPLVKLYSAEGEFICVVAGPEQVPAVAADVAADSRDRILILDPQAGSVRVFEHKESLSGAER